MDDTGTYSTGICGEKTITLDAGTPSFLSLTPDILDPVLNPSTLAFDSASATGSDIGTYTIGYTVIFKEYPALAALTATFTFELKCPDSVVSSSLDTPVPSSPAFVYDLALEPIEIAYPVISVNPAECFTVDSFELSNFYAFSNTDFITDDGAKFTIETTDRSLTRSTQIIEVSAVTNSDERLHQHQFSV